MEKYIIYSDESDRKGIKYSFFLGAIILKKENLEYIENYLINSKGGYPGEVKWNKIKDSNWKIDIYKNFVNAIFDLMETGYLKFRLSFVPNICTQLYKNTEEELSFFKIYHMFLYKNFHFWDIFLINLDRLPYNNAQKVLEFKDFIKSKLNIEPSQIAELDSSKHVILQAVDIILGAMCSKLNQKMAEKQPNGKRAKSTLAKEKIYKEVMKRVKSLTPKEYYENFSIGITTSKAKNREVDDKYRHYQYSKEKVLTNGKGGNPNSPTQSHSHIGA